MLAVLLLLLLFGLWISMPFSLSVLPCCCYFSTRLGLVAAQLSSVLGGELHSLTFVQRWPSARLFVLLANAAALGVEYTIYTTHT